LIDGLLTLASSEQGMTEHVRVDLADLVHRVSDESREPAQAAHINIRTHLATALVRGDPVLLERLTKNLLDNAIRYNVPDGGEIIITTTTVDSDVYPSVENTGRPTSPHDVPTLFEPFRRLPATDRLADSSRTPAGRGAGLGLSIVRSVAHAHDGDVDAA